MSVRTAQVQRRHVTVEDKPSSKWRPNHWPGANKDAPIWKSLEKDKKKNVHGHASGNVSVNVRGDV